MPAEYVPQVYFLQVMHIHLVSPCSKTFLCFQGRRRFTEEGLSIIFSGETVSNVQVVHHLKNEFPSTQYFATRFFKQQFSLMPYLSVFFGINTMKGQHDFRTIKCLSTVNENIRLYFHWHIHANVWKTTKVCTDRSAPLAQCTFGLIYHPISNTSGTQ